jgi:hypothetical protein
VARRWIVYTQECHPGTWGVSRLIVDRQHVVRGLLAIVEAPGAAVALPPGVGNARRGVCLFVDAPVIVVAHHGGEIRGWHSVTDLDVERGCVPAQDLQPLRDRTGAARATA